MEAASVLALLVGGPSLLLEEERGPSLSVLVRSGSSLADEEEGPASLSCSSFSIVLRYGFCMALFYVVNIQNIICIIMFCGVCLPLLGALSG